MQLNDVVYSKLTDEDVNDISLLFLDKRYKALVKLQNNIIIDLQNKFFKQGEKLEEFLGIKWAKEMVLLQQTQVKNLYDKSINIQNNAKATKSPEHFEQVPDGVPIGG